MRTKTSREVLWDNVHTLMVQHYGKENLTRLSREAHLGPATVSRIKEQQTSIGVDVLDSLAKLFNVQPWRLLCPSLGEGQERPPAGSPAVMRPETKAPASATLKSREPTHAEWPFGRLTAHRFRTLPPEEQRDIETYAVATADAYFRHNRPKSNGTSQ